MKTITILLAMAMLLTILAGCREQAPAKTNAPTAPETTQAAIPETTEAPTEESTEAPTEPTVTAIDPMALVGQWERTQIEVEGYMEENTDAVITIEGDSSEALFISYTDLMFPEEGFSLKALMLDQREMYYGCGNDQWVMDVDYIGPYDTEYTVTLLEDGRLLKQNYFLIDGAPMVSYEYFSKK